VGAFRPDEAGDAEAFAKTPDEVHAFYNMRRRNFLSAQPNAAHFGLAQLEAGMAEQGGDLFLCTQNIDDLHERASSRRVTHMHGELLKARCLSCEAIVACTDDLSRERACAACGRSGVLRPDVVWFGEMPMHMDAIYAALAKADLFVAVGTSGAVLSGGRNGS
jgi:NAD-dependent deacetylase